MLKQEQLTTLFFAGSTAAAARRLALLYHHGFLRREFLTVRASYQFSPILYLIDNDGLDLLRVQLGEEAVSNLAPRSNLKRQFLEHTLAINEVRIRITLTCQNAGYTLLIWRGETELKAEYDRVNTRTRAGYSRAVSVIPDSYFVIDTPRGKTHFFLELDRGSMSTLRFQSKVAAYLNYYNTGAYERRYNTKSLRILTVTMSPRRLENLKAVTERTGGGQRFWFGLLAELTIGTILNAPVWSVATTDNPMPLIETAQGAGTYSPEHPSS